jgi:hypothetical protein
MEHQIAISWIIALNWQRSIRSVAYADLSGVQQAVANKVFSQ